MPKVRTELEAAAGRLISTIQKEWSRELGDPEAKESEETMDRAHTLLQNVKLGVVNSILKGMTVSEFLGSEWIVRHPAVLPSVQEFEVTLKKQNDV